MNLSAFFKINSSNVKSRNEFIKIQLCLLLLTSPKNFNKDKFFSFLIHLVALKI